MTNRRLAPLPFAVVGVALAACSLTNLDHLQQACAPSCGDAGGGGRRAAREIAGAGIAARWQAKGRWSS